MKTKLFLLLTPILLSCFAFLPIARAAPSPSNVNVVNTTASPVPVRDVDNPARQPFEAQGMGGFADGASTTGDITIATVPAGKRLVIEYVSMVGAMPLGERILLAGTKDDGTVDDPVVTVPTESGTNADGTLDYFIASQLVRVYMDPGRINCSAERNSTVGANPNSVRFTISG